MYPNKIDELIDKVIEDVYISIIENKSSKNVIKKASGIDNFVQYQGEIDDIIFNYIETLPINEIEEVTQNNDRIKDIIEVLKHYVMLYIMLTLGARFKAKNGKIDKFISNVVEYTKNQKQYKLRINDFFNSASTSNVIKFTYMIRNIQKLMNHSPVISNLHLLKNDNYSEETSDFLIDLTDDYIDAAFVNQSDNDRNHNIIKTIIILKVYTENDKKRLYTMIEQSEQTKGEYKFMDIFVPKSDIIDYAMIEAALSEEEVKTGEAKRIWDYLQSFNAKSDIMDNNSKINELFNNELVVPILDDFLLYHRETEKYDKESQKTQQYAGRDDTKLRYIVSKIGDASELYSQSVKNNKKTLNKILSKFSPPLYNKKAILRNEIEERKILKGADSISGAFDNDNIGYIEDLKMYRKYAYVNFKSFDKYGFSHYFTKTITAVRAVNTETEGVFRQINNNHKVQTRVASSDDMGNVVGLMILPNTSKPIQCMTIADLMDVRDIKKGKKNGYEMFYTVLRKILFSGMKNSKGIYWIFDPEKDQDNRSDTGSAQTSNLKISSSMPSAQQQNSTMIKNMLADMYDRLLIDTKESILEFIDDYDKTRINIQIVDRVINYINDNYMTLTEDIIFEIKRYYFKTMIQMKPSEFDTNILYGLEGDVINLPKYKPPERLMYNNVEINLGDIDTSGEIIEVESVQGICQHNITFDLLSKNRNVSYNEKMRMFHEFMGKYVTEDTNKNYVCKSCGHHLDIQKYVEDGKYDDSTKQFITFTSVMYVDISILPEYRELDRMIGQIDKDINKICSSIGINYYVGSNDKIKSRRRNIIKSTIDMLRLNNPMLNGILKKYNLSKEKAYGVSSKISQIFTFELKNDIYFMSSADKDKIEFKMKKKNNILVYLMIFLMMELNEGQISFFLQDNKMISIKAFNVFFRKIYGKLKIIKNDKFETMNVTDYPLLCYTIYMISARIVKHKAWSHPLIPIGNKPISHKQIPAIQIFVIHTMIDVINSILLNSFRYLNSIKKKKVDSVTMKKKDGMRYIFDIFRTRFYNSLDTVYSNTEFYDTLLMQSKDQYALGYAHKVKEIKNFREWSFQVPLWNPCQPQRYFARKQQDKIINLHSISNLTHCEDGTPHNWEASKKKKTCVCSNCSKLMSEIKYDAALSKKIRENVRRKTLNILGLKFCLADGLYHQYENDAKANKIKCVKCGKSDKHVYSDSDIDKIEKLLTNVRMKVSETEETRNKYVEEDRKEETNYNQKVMTKLMKDIEDNNITGYDFVNDFVNVLRDAIGSDEIKGEFPINLIHDTYIINHNRYGTLIDGDPIIISEVNAKFTVKKNHKHFKRDVLYYTDSSEGVVDIFYDAVTKRLLGYKEASKNYVNIENSNRKIRINYSILNKLKLLGYSERYLNIYDYNPELSEKYDGKSIDERQKLYIEIVQSISRKRLESLNNIMLNFQKTINAILNGYDKLENYRTTTVEDGFKRTEVKHSGISLIPYSTNNTNDYAPESITYHSSKRDDIIQRYTKKLKNVIVANQKGKIFKHWKGVKRGNIQIDYSKSDMYINSDSDLLDMLVINEYDNVSRNTLYYILREITKLIDYNKKPFVKNSVANFVAEFIDRTFFEYNNEYITTDVELRRFQYIMMAKQYVTFESQETSTTIVGDSGTYTVDDEMNESDALALMEEMDNNNYMNEAMDMDEEYLEDNMEGMLEDYHDRDLSRINGF